MYFRVVVRLGDLNLNDTVNDGTTTVDVGVLSERTHQHYDSQINSNDIVLLYLNVSVTFNSEL